ncbi:hypothetical protein AVEN_214650-1 [Araneus ventricosus]|uniref:Uncharacterized protein n=1 Tax=Araneus ventricosus TaxID=182803 RepID=A0A4Y2TI19_ARAVE|nr:hypothetical protein AVEN_114541-1 [Araneus ventricosus]GBN99106.1 hypothetical protein AVEN_142059-1 [Araneus ventricosus]GBN99107.1 hypothetical protein AVEN_214650-1 [Araneus ventricosus]
MPPNLIRRLKTTWQKDSVIKLVLKISDTEKCGAVVVYTTENLTNEKKGEISVQNQFNTANELPQMVTEMKLQSTVTPASFNVTTLLLDYTLYSVHNILDDRK